MVSIAVNVLLQDYIKDVGTLCAIPHTKCTVKSWLTEREQYDG